MKIPLYRQGTWPSNRLVSAFIRIILVIQKWKKVILLLLQSCLYSKIEYVTETLVTELYDLIQKEIPRLQQFKFRDDSFDKVHTVKSRKTHIKLTEVGKQWIVSALHSAQG